MDFVALEKGRLSRPTLLDYRLLEEIVSDEVSDVVIVVAGGAHCGLVAQKLPRSDFEIIYESPVQTKQGQYFANMNYIVAEVEKHPRDEITARYQEIIYPLESFVNAMLPTQELATLYEEVVCAFYGAKQELLTWVLQKFPPKKEGLLDLQLAQNMKDMLEGKIKSFRLV